MLLYLLIIKIRTKVANSDNNPAEVLFRNFPHGRNLLFPVAGIGSSASGLATMEPWTAQETG